MKNIRLSFKGYWRAEKKDFIPHFMGVYLVYRGVYNANEDTVSLRDLVYIGQAEDVNRRINEHIDDPSFTGILQGKEILCFSVAQVSSNEIDLVENALIFAQKPILNTNLKQSYNHEAAGFVIEGRCSLLRYTSFTISR